ncbi:thermonuclease family protein [Sneathiella sp.]|uniref:thermonuclease family protein n=1 Tax=Sneathiella sp. TaxID=1964365 RepID=UPI003567F555
MSVVTDLKRYLAARKLRVVKKNCLTILLVAGTSVSLGVVISLAPQILSRTNDYSTPMKIAGSVHIVDGDTLWMKGQKIRLAGIDAPESQQTCISTSRSRYQCGIAARNFLKDLIADQPVQCDSRSMDKYGRLLATCYIGTRDINAEMVSAGWAVAYRHYSDKYAAKEDIAKQAEKGIWDGSFQIPWVWRRDHESDNISTAARGTRNCNIKGNISENGNIYHLPGERWYEETGINMSKGERWFCSEKEAVAAGWRHQRSYD